MGERIRIKKGSIDVIIEEDQTLVGTNSPHSPEEKHQSDELPSSRANDALKYSWDWFSLHATQRLQSVNFFIVAASFITAAYVTASKEHLHWIAAMICLLGAGMGYIFYKLEQRVRELLHHGESALKKCEEVLADATGILEAQISTTADRDSKIWRYSRTFKFLYLGTSFFFSIGCISEIIFNLQLPVAQTQSDASLLVVGALVLIVVLYGAYAGLRFKGEDSRRESFYYIVLSLMLLAGLVLICFGLRNS